MKNYDYVLEVLEMLNEEIALTKEISSVLEQYNLNDLETALLIKRLKPRLNQIIHNQG